MVLVKKGAKCLGENTDNINGVRGLTFCVFSHIHNKTPSLAKTVAQGFFFLYVIEIKTIVVVFIHSMYIESERGKNIEYIFP